MIPILTNHKKIHISEQYPEMDLIKSASSFCISRNGQSRQQEEPILEEHVIDVFVNERLTMKLICIPQFLAELVLGRLLTEGIITESGSVETLYICEHGRRARVYLKNVPSREPNAETAPSPESGRGVSGPRADGAPSENPGTRADDAPSENPGIHAGDAPSKDPGTRADDAPSENYIELTPACCTGNRILNDYFVNQREPSPIVPIPWKISWIFQLADRFSQGMPVHSRTWCTHSCFLAWRDELLFQCEDIGRHNALDKAIGYALRHGIDLRQCILYSSGRVPTDMALKAIRAGIPILSSKASPTFEAVQLAKEYGLTLICGARRDQMKLFAGEPPVPENTGL